MNYGQQMHQTYDGKEVNDMPGGDKSGPMGQGPMTGRGAGFCAGSDAPGYADPGMGPGLGRGRGRGLGRGAWGRGRGFRNWFRATGLPFWARTQPSAGPTPAQETEQLRTQAGWLEGQLDAIAQRLNELKGQE